MMFDLKPYEDRQLSSINRLSFYYKNLAFSCFRHTEYRHTWCICYWNDKVNLSIAVYFLLQLLLDTIFFVCGGTRTHQGHLNWLKWVLPLLLNSIVCLRSYGWLNKVVRVDYPTARFRIKYVKHRNPHY